jgi:hypothetical protein
VICDLVVNNFLETPWRNLGLPIQINRCIQDTPGFSFPTILPLEEGSDKQLGAFGSAERDEIINLLGRPGYQK